MISQYKLIFHNLISAMPSVINRDVMYARSPLQTYQTANFFAFISSLLFNSTNTAHHTCL